MKKHGKLLLKYLLLFVMTVFVMGCFSVSAATKTGFVTQKGKTYYINKDGSKQKGWLELKGKKYYFDANSGEAVTNRFIQISRGVWYYFNASGQAVTGEQVINGQHLYFDASGRQVKGRYVWVKGQRRYYDANTGAWVRKR